MLTPAILSEIGEALYGPRWVSPLARDLAVTYQTVLNWRQGVVPLPANLVSRLRPVVRARIKGAESARSLLWSKS